MPDPAVKPPARTRTQPATKSQTPRVEATTDAPPADKPATGTTTPAKATPAKRQPRKTAPAKSAPAAKTTPAKTTPAKATPAKVAPAKASPADQAPAQPPAAKAGPVKRAAVTVKAAAAEIAPAVVTPDMTTVPDEQPPPTPATPEPDQAPPGNAPSAADEVMPADFPDLAAVVQEKGRAASVVDTLSGVRTEVWAALVADPGHAPELLAVAATQTIGPRAREWASRTRAAYPGATPDALARLAVSQFTRFGSVSSVFAAVAGSYAPIALLGAAAFTHAELALHVAAAYGLDPSDRERAVDLLVLTRVHPGREDAVAALAEAEKHSYDSAGLTDASWRLGRMVAAQAGGWAAVRAVNHFFPGTSLLVATLTSRGAARAMAARATLHYRSVRAS